MQTLIIRTNVNTNENYDVYGNSFRGGSPRFVVNSKMRVEWRLYSATPKANEDTVDVSTWTAFTGYSGCSAKLGCDDDWIHRVTGTYTGEAVSAGGTLSEISARISGASDKSISASGLVTLYNSNGQFETFLYTSRAISGETVVFDLGASVTCAYDHANGESLNATQELLFQTAMNASVSDTAHGVFVFDVITTSRKLQQKVDTANSGIIAIQGVELLPFKVNGTETEQQPSILLDTAILETTMQEAGMPAPVTDPVSDQIGAEAAAIVGSGLSIEVTSDGGATWSAYTGSGTYMGRGWLTAGGSANKTVFPLLQGPPGSDGRDGADGSQGPEGTLTEVYPYNISSAYSRLDIVTYNGGGYQVISSDGASAGESPETASSKYILIAAPGSNGSNGSDGVSPTVTLTQLQSGVQIVTSDAGGSAFAFVSNGVDGSNGSDGIPPVISGGSAYALSSGSAPEVAATSSGGVVYFDFGIPAGPKGDPGDSIASANIPVSSLTSGAISVTHTAFPVALKTNEGNFYPVEKGTLTESSGSWLIDPAAYLAYDNVSSFTGPWTVYFAGGLPDSQPIIAGGTSIEPEDHRVFKHALAANDSFTFDTSGLSSSECVTFELWLDMPSAAVSFTLPSMTWVDGAAPDFSSASTRYVIVVRWNGTKLLANLAYTESLA